MQISTKNILFIKLHIFKYNLTFESCEHPLKSPIFACHCSMSTDIIPQYKQPSYVNQYNNKTKSVDYNSEIYDCKQAQ